MNDLQCRLKAQALTEQIVQLCDADERLLGWRVVNQITDSLEDALRWAYTEGQCDLKQEHKQALDDWVNHGQSNRQKRTVSS